MDKEALKLKFRAKMRPLTLALNNLGLSPLAVSIIGLVICGISGYIVARGSLFWGALVFLIGSTFDMLDGDLARMQGVVSRRGAFLDSCFDRLGEAALFAGLTWYFMDQRHDHWQFAVLMILLTVVGSITTSYVRARAEGVGETCFVGLMQRPERVALLGLGMLLGWWMTILVLTGLAGMTLATTVQRIVHVARKLPGPRQDAATDAPDGAAAGADDATAPVTAPPVDERPDDDRPEESP